MFKGLTILLYSVIISLISYKYFIFKDTFVILFIFSNS